MTKYYVIESTKNGVRYKRTKCLDYWSNTPEGCWQFSYQGAKNIAERLNNRLTEEQKKKVHYNILKVTTD